MFMYLFARKHQEESTSESMLLHHCESEECDIFLRRVAHICAPKPNSGWDLLKETEPIADLVSKTYYGGLLLEGTNQHVNNSQHPTTDDPFNVMRHLPTGLHTLDDCLRGGLRVGTITEVVGRAGTGKTQLAMQLCVIAARYRQGSIYIDTEKKLSLHRLREIAERRTTMGHTSTCNYSSFSYDQSSSTFPASATQEVGTANYHLTSDNAVVPYRNSKEVLDNCTILAPTTTSELLSALVEVEELILVRNQEAADAKLRERLQQQQQSVNHQNIHNLEPTVFPVRLLILDSIAAPTKRGFGCESAPERAAAVFQCAQRLKQLAHQLQVAVLVVNQVFLDQQQGGSLTGDTSINVSSSVDPVTIKAALGTSWHHCVSTRILLEYHQQQQQEFQQENGHKSRREGSANDRTTYTSTTIKENRATRRATVVKSNVVGTKSAAFEVSTQGLVDVAPIESVNEDDPHY
jgi:RecA/RadA recombinase